MKENENEREKSTSLSNEHLSSEERDVKNKYHNGRGKDLVVTQNSGSKEWQEQKD
jgi:hypothetical protein